MNLLEQDEDWYILYNIALDQWLNYSTDISRYLWGDFLEDACSYCPKMWFSTDGIIVKLNRYGLITSECLDNRTLLMFRTYEENGLEHVELDSGRHIHEFSEFKRFV
jgi:hypothetical protein